MVHTTNPCATFWLAFVTVGSEYGWSLGEGAKFPFNFMLVTQKEQFGISVVRFVKTWTFVGRLVIHKAAPRGITCSGSLSWSMKGIQKQNYHIH